MKNKEITEGLAHCFNVAEYSDCNDCPYRDKRGKRCTHALYDDTLDFINSQQEKLKVQANNIHAILKMKDVELQRIKAEAIKEFARKLKCGVSITSGIITSEDVDNLVKEMAGVRDE